MASGRELALRITAADATSAAFRSVQHSLSGLERAAAAPGKALGAMFDGVSGAIGAPIRAIGGLTDVLGKIGLAGLGVKALASTFAGLGDALGVGLNSQLEQTRGQILALTKSEEQTAAILRLVQDEADRTAFSFEGINKAATMLIPSARMSGESLQDLIKVAEILAATNPEQGIEGAAYALREAVSGDFVSLMERFNIPRTLINQFKAEGVPAIEIVRRSLAAMGIDYSIVAAQAETAAGKWDIFMGSVNRLRAQIGEPIFDAWKVALDGLIGAFDANREAIQTWAARVAAAIGVAISAAGALAGGFASALGSALSIVQSIGQAIYEALSWLNPFASHSPSLVSQVEAGVQAIVDSYGDLSQVATAVDPAARSLTDLGKMAGQVGVEVGRSMADMASGMGRLGAVALPSVSGDPLGGLAERFADFVRASGGIDSVTQAWRGLTGSISGSAEDVARSLAVMPGGLEYMQSALGETTESVLRLGDSASSVDYVAEAVARFKDGHDNLKDSVRDADRYVGDLKETLSGYQSQLDNLSRTPLLGTAAFDEKSFQIDQQIAAVQKQLNEAKLAMPDLGAGPGRAPGAKEPQWVKDQYQAAQDAYRDAQEAQRASLAPMEEQLTRLRLQADQVRLTEKLQLDPLKRQLESIAKPVQEASFDGLAAGMREARRAVDELSPRVAIGSKALAALKREAEDAAAAAKGAAGGGGGGVAAIAGGLGGALKVGGLAEAGQQVEDFKAKVAEARASIERNLAPVQRILRVFGDTIGQVFRGNAKGAMDVFLAGFMDPLRRVGVDVIEVRQRLQSIGDWLGQMGESIGKADLGGVLKTWFAGLSGIAETVGTWLAEQWGKIDWVAVWGGAKGFVGGLLGAYGEIYGSIAGWLGEQWARIDWGAVWARASGLAGEIGKGLGDIAGTVGVWLGEQWAKIDWPAVWKQVTGMGEGLATALGKASAGIPIIQDIKKVLADLAPTGERISNLFGLLRDAVVTLVDKLAPLTIHVNTFANLTAESAPKTKDLTDAINAISGALESAATWFGKNMLAQSALVGVLTAAATAWTLSTVAAAAHTIALGAQAIATAGLATVTAALNVILTANPIGLVVVALAGLTAGLLYAYNNSEDFRTAVNNAWSAVQSFAKGVTDTVVPAVQGFIDKIAVAIQWVKDLIAAIAQLPTKLMAPTTDNAPAGPGLASGTRNWRGGLAIVGEQGRELVSLPRGGSVYSHGETERMLQGGASLTVGSINVYANGGDPQAVAAATELGILRAARSMGVAS